MNKDKYRLDEYLITGYEDVPLSWERHIALGEQLSGRCFICGDILIIGQCSHQESGYLIGEFLDQLRDLPLWNKTRYYCTASSLLDIETGQNLKNDFFEQRLSLANEGKSGPRSAAKLEPGTFRLGRYEITVAGDRSVSWKTCEGLNSAIGGKCIIESGILFVAAREYDTEGPSKREFLNALDHLPQWDKTIAWGHFEVLQVCGQQAERINHRPAARAREAVETGGFDKSPAPKYLSRWRDKAVNLMSLSIGWLKTSCRGVHVGWSQFLLPLLVLIVLFLLTALWYSADKLLHHRAHSEKEHHHEHDD